MTTLAPTKEKQVVLKAIDSLGRRVTAADVASKTGLPILTCNATLNQIAAETQGHMEVGQQGDIAYRFSPGFQTTYLAKGIFRVLEQVWGVLFAVGFFLLRISFGVMLILSVIIVIALIFAIILYGQSRGGDSRRDDGFPGFNFRLSFFDWLILRDILFATTYYSTPTRYRYDTPTYRKADKSNFFFNTFSFLFGDGNPNLNLEERKWQMIAEVIRRSNGVVTAEQLAPYTGGPPDSEDSVLSTLVRFDGKPEVTENGDIIYVFPSMQVTASEHHQEVLPSYLSEWTWKFSNVPADQMIPVYLLAGFNFVGSWFLWFQIMSVSVDSIQLSRLAGLVTLLVVYGTLFLVVPLVRFFVISSINGGIEKRNAERLSYANQLQDPSDKLLKKLAAAQQLKVDTKILSEDKTIFTTEKDSLEQEFDATP